MFCGLLMNSVGPGFMFFMYSTPITIAVIESPGMPNTSAGIHAPASALLLAAPDSTMPSTWPVPNFSGSFEKLLAHRVGHPGRDVGAGAGQHADQRAERAAAQRSATGTCSASAHMPLEDVADLLRRRSAAGGSMRRT